MKIALLGSGNGAQALGAAFLAQGHQVKMGTRNPQKPEAQAWASQHGANASVATYSEAATWGELALLVVKGEALEEAILLTDPKNLAGKVVVDVTNPLTAGVSGGPPKLSVGFTDSLGERAQKLLPNSHVVKAFNTVSLALINNPVYPAGKPTMFIAGNDATAKQTVSTLLTTFGWDAVDLGDIEQSRLLEPLALVWITCGYKSGKWDHAFKLMHK